MSEIVIVAAMDINRAIGRNNALLWHIPEDLKHFKSLTMGHTVLMGRKTFESVGRPLPKRRNVVITRNLDWKFPDVEVYQSLEEALYALKSLETIMIVGGAEVYSQAMPLANKLEITHIEAAFKDADSFFPVIDEDFWQESSRKESVQPETGLKYAFVSYLRKPL